MEELDLSFMAKYIAKCPDYSSLLRTLLDIYLMTYDPKIERKIIDLFGVELLQSMLETYSEDQP